MRWSFFQHSAKWLVKLGLEMCVVAKAGSPPIISQHTYRCWSEHTVAADQAAAPSSAPYLTQQSLHLARFCQFMIYRVHIRNALKRCAAIWVQKRHPQIIWFDSDESSPTRFVLAYFSVGDILVLYYGLVFDMIYHVLHYCYCLLGSILICGMLVLRIAQCKHCLLNTEQS